MMRKSISGNFKKKSVFFLAGVILIGIAVWQLSGIGIEQKQEGDTYRRLKKTAMEETGTEEPKEKDRKKDEKETFDYRKVRVDFDALKKRNKDIVGWILFDQNGISYPVVQGADNETYLHVMADGTKNPAGSIFVDASCEADFMDLHTIVYGHNMKNLSMFGKLKQYRREEAYYKENQYFTIYTPNRIFRYEIFGWYEAAADDALYQTDFLDREEWEKFVEQMLERRYRDTGVTADGMDRIVTLSTCSGEGMRFVVHGKLTDEIESGNEKEAPHEVR